MCLKTENKEFSNLCCCIITVLSAIISAIGISSVFYLGLLESIATLTIITLALGIFELIYLIISNICGNFHCKSLDKFCLIPIVVGSIVVPIFTLINPIIIAGSIAVACLIGSIGFFLTLSLINFLKIFLNFIVSNRCNDYIEK